MAETIVSFGVEKLWELVSQEYELLQGVDEQVTELKSDLNMLMSFLKDADAKKQTSALARNCVEEIKEITYDAEDIIETFLLKEDGRNGNRIKNRMRRLPCVPGGRREIALEITSISKRISKVIHVMQTFGIQPMIIDGGYSQALQERKRETRHTFSSESERNLVGLEKNVERLVVELVGKDSSQVVSITGLGGLGKTTLARQTILWNLSPGDKNINMTEDQLQRKLVQLLETQKALIVFDDIWTRKDWDTIKPMFPERNAAGWKILLTSRNDVIHPQCVTFKPDFLTPKECWTLLQRIAFPKNDTTGYIIDKEMVEMAQKMLEHCGGLPLAVKVLGGLLAMQHTLRQWKLIYENIKSHIVGGIGFNDEDNSSVYFVLSLSFEGLPVYLKHCLLYLASFPEDHEIDLEKVSYYWAAEEIPKPRHYEGATIRDVADVYIEELVKRNMVISERDIMTSRFETCRLHDVMRELCLLKIKEENFLQIATAPTEDSQAPTKSRRLVVYCSSTFHGNLKLKNPKLRSILIIPVESVLFSVESCSGFTRLQFMKVLDLTRARFKGMKLPSYIGKLIHLRCLCLYDAWITHLPSSLQNLKLLLYLNLCVHGNSSVYVPNVFKEMQELRYLCLPTKMHGKTKLELGNLVKLETLKHFSTETTNVKDLQGMTRLRTLLILSRGGCTMEALSSSVAKLIHLEDLSIDWKPVNKGDAGKFVLNFVNLHKLALWLYMPKLPDEQHLSPHLTTITLACCCMEEDPMPILGKLPHLNELRLAHQSFCGRRMVCMNDGFPQLHTLEIAALEKWEEWIVEEGSMPLLHYVKNFQCENLKEVPDGLRFVTSLKEMIINTRGRKLKKLDKGGEDYYKVQHIPRFRVLSH